MSYDVWFIEMDINDLPVDVIDAFNYTSNLAGAWITAGAHLRAWDGKRCSEIVDQLRVGIETIESELPYYRKFNPENNWGDVDSSLEQFLKPILAVCEKHPTAIIRVSN